MFPKLLLSQFAQIERELKPNTYAALFLAATVFRILNCLRSLIVDFFLLKNDPYILINVGKKFCLNRSLETW